MPNLGTWKISIGGQPFADYTDILNPEGIAGAPNIMEILGYGAPAKVYLNLGNFAGPQKFTMTRTHTSDTDAHNWYQTAVATWSGVATVVLTHIDYESVETQYQIAGAKILLEVETPIGISTTTHITITGGAPTQL